MKTIYFKVRDEIVCPTKVRLGRNNHDFKLTLRKLRIIYRSGFQNVAREVLAELESL